MNGMVFHADLVIGVESAVRCPAPLSEEIDMSELDISGRANLFAQLSHSAADPLTASDSPSADQALPRTLIEFGATQSHLLYREANQPLVSFQLPLGYRQLGRGALRQTPPDPWELEMAIAWVEDQIMPLARWLHPGTLHVLCPPLAILRPNSGQRALPREEVETWFQHLAAQSERDPLAHGWPILSTDAAGALLILREWLHHLGFTAVRIESEGAH